MVHAGDKKARRPEQHNEPRQDLLRGRPAGTRTLIRAGQRLELPHPDLKRLMACGASRLRPPPSFGPIAEIGYLHLVYYEGIEMLVGEVVEADDAVLAIDIDGIRMEGIGTLLPEDILRQVVL